MFLKVSLTLLSVVVIPLIPLLSSVGIHIIRKVIDIWIDKWIDKKKQKQIKNYKNLERLTEIVKGISKEKEKLSVISGKDQIGSINSVRQSIDNVLGYENEISSIVKKYPKKIYKIYHKRIFNTNKLFPKVIKKPADYHSVDLAYIEKHYSYIKKIEPQLYKYISKEKIEKKILNILKNI